MTVAQRLARDRKMRLRRDKDLRQAVVDDIGELARREIGIDVGVVEARAVACNSAFDVTRMVLHEDGVVVGPLEAHGSHEMCDLVGARLQLSVRDRLARLSHDDSGMTGVGGEELLHRSPLLLFPFRRQPEGWPQKHCTHCGLKTPTRQGAFVCAIQTPVAAGPKKRQLTAQLSRSAAVHNQARPSHHNVRSSPNSRLTRATNSSSLSAASATTCSSVLLARPLSACAASGPAG